MSFLSSYVFSVFYFYVGRENFSFFIDSISSQPSAEVPFSFTLLAHPSKIRWLWGEVCVCVCVCVCRARHSLDKWAMACDNVKLKKFKKCLFPFVFWVGGCDSCIWAKICSFINLCLSVLYFEWGRKGQVNLTSGRQVALLLPPTESSSRCGGNCVSDTHKYDLGKCSFHSICIWPFITDFTRVFLMLVRTFRYKGNNEAMTRTEG